MQCAGFSLRWLLLQKSLHTGTKRWLHLRSMGSRRAGLVAPQHVGSSRTRARTHVPCFGRLILNHCATREVPRLTSCQLKAFACVLHLLIKSSPGDNGLINSKVLYGIQTIFHFLLCVSVLRDWKLSLSKQSILFVLEWKNVHCRRK